MTMTPRPGDGGLTRGTGAVMASIRVLTGSRYGHAAVCVDEPTESGRIPIVEAMPGGVRERLVDPSEIWVWSRVPMTDEQRVGVVRTVRGALGRGYDYPSVATFAIRRKWARIRKGSEEHFDKILFCSEMWVWAWRANHVADGPDGKTLLLPDYAPRDISPGDLREWEASGAWLPSTS